MCGIYATNFSISEKEIQKNLNRIEFRGPDNQSSLRLSNLTLGHNRLAILDLDSRSNQPMRFENLVIVFNGEIYNYNAVKAKLETEENYSFTTTSDTEVLLKAYHAWGDKMLQLINGMFAFSIYDIKKELVFSARDRLGVKPFYYSWNDGKFEICSQLAPFSKKGMISQQAIAIYLQTGYIPSPFSIYENIFKLPPGHTLEFDLKKNKKTLKKYWDLDKVKIQKFTYKQAKEQLHDLMKDAVKIRMQSDVPYGSFLSGGIDSALVTAIASKVSNEKIKTFTIGFEDPKFDESKLAKKFSEILNTDHTETLCKAKDLINLLPTFFKVYDEPFADSSAIPSLLLNKTTKPMATVALSGDGGDESFLGYNHFQWVNKARIFFKIPYWLRKAFSSILPFRLLGKKGRSIKNIFLYQTINTFIESIFIGFDSILLKKDDKWLDRYRDYKKTAKHVIQKTADLNIKLWLENDSNVKVDRASMAFSVEVRSPFLDYRIVEFARTLPVHFRYKNSIRKRIVRDILSEYIPEKVFNTPKMGFGIPIQSWIRNDLFEEFKNVINSHHLEELEILNKDKIKSMFKAHVEGKEDYSAYLWRVYILFKWLETNEASE
ncbi:MAG: asparagine synthase (glutamine-hydrolyzing) [Flavobacteriaceae bacterium]